MKDLGLGAISVVGMGKTWGHDGGWNVPMRLPMIVSDEVAELSARYGTPVKRTFHVQADDYIYSYRFNRTIDRPRRWFLRLRMRPGGCRVHAKSHYPLHIYRLPTGGVHWDELVLDGLLREVKEETGVPVEIARFLGIIGPNLLWHFDSPLCFLYFPSAYSRYGFSIYPAR